MKFATCEDFTLGMGTFYKDRQPSFSELLAAVTVLSVASAAGAEVPGEASCTVAAAACIWLSLGIELDELVEDEATPFSKLDASIVKPLTDIGSGWAGGEVPPEFSVACHTAAMVLPHLPVIWSNAESASGAEGMDGEAAVSLCCAGLWILAFWP